MDNIDVCHGAVIEERSSAPLTADEADAAVTKPIVNTSIEADVRSPVAWVEHVHATLPAPVCGRPEDSGAWRLHPDAWNPVIAVRTVGPVAGRTQGPRTGAELL